MKKIKYGLFLAGLMALTGCAGIEEVYKQGEFHTAVFEDNYYRGMPTRYENGEYVETIYEITEHVAIGDPITNVFPTIVLGDYARGNISLAEILNNYGSQAAKDIKRDEYNSEMAYVDALMTELSRSSSASWFNYAIYNNLVASNKNDSVKNAFKKGVFSKLTDGIIVCNGGGSLVRVQIDEAGIGETFEHELINYRNFVLSARGGTNLDYGAIGELRVTSVKVRINISFYIEKSSTNSVARKETLTYVVDELQSDRTTMTTLMSVDLTKVLPAETLKRVSGMTINYELLEHNILKPGDNSPASHDGEFALMLYEVMLPYSTWR